jgi:hypothetical protein
MVSNNILTSKEKKYLEEQSFLCQAYRSFENQEYELELLECLSCQRTIPDPVCPQCLTDEFVSWMDNYPKLKGKKSMIRKISKFLASHSSFNENSTKCIECGNKRAFMCPYCFTTHLWTILKESNKSKKLLKEFFTYFDFDKNHKGYWKEGEALGLI